MTTSTRTAPRLPLLRTALLLDAAVTVANGALYLALAPALDGLLGLPAGTLRVAGGFLLAFGVAVGLLGRLAEPPARAVLAVVTANAAWVAGSVLAAATGWRSPTGVGTAWLVLQAVVVAGFAALQVLAPVR